MGRISTYKSPKVEELEKKARKERIVIIQNPKNSRMYKANAQSSVWINEVYLFLMKVSKVEVQLIRKCRMAHETKGPWAVLLLFCF